MNITDNIEVHSIALSKALHDIEMLRQRTHEIGQRLSVHDYMFEESVKVSMETLKALKENRELIEKLNLESFRRGTVIDFLAEKLSGKKFFGILFFSFMLIEAYSITPIIFKHFLGW